MTRILILASFLITSLLAWSSTTVADESDYVVVVSRATHEDPQWSRVVDALVSKHSARVVVFDGDVSDSLEDLRRRFPKHTCFVATPQEAGRKFVASVHQLARQLDDDPYTDTLWGILTGYEADNALAIAQHQTPLTIRKVGSGTEIALECCVEGLWYDELVKNKLVRKERGRTAQQHHGPDDTTQAFADLMSEYKPDLFVTSGHATERGWQIGFGYRNGFLKSHAGRMFGETTDKQRIEIDSPNPKVYLPIGNCLMGNIDGPDAMALAWMNDMGVKQMIGYTVPTWFGYQGWGVLDYFVEQPGRYTLTEAFFANHHALTHQLENKTGNQRGLTFDRDVVAFYGDPAWIAKMADGPKRFEQSLSHKDGVFTLTITPKMGEKSFEPVNTNGSQRGGRPIVAYLPHRIGPAEIIAGSDLRPTITDDFVLVPLPEKYEPNREYKVVFRTSSR